MRSHLEPADTFPDQSRRTARTVLNASVIVETMRRGPHPGDPRADAQLTTGEE